MSSGAKVIPLNAGAAMRAPTAERSLPAGLQPLRDSSRDFIKQGLQRIFDAADDSLFEAGQRVASSMEQQELFDAMRTLRLKRESIEKELLDGLDKAFREIGSNHNQAVMDVLPAGLLTLVSHDELEESVAVKTMVMRSLGDSGTEFNPLQQRLQALVGVPVTEDNNPLSARTLCTLMLGALSPLQLKIQIRLVLLKLFEKHLVKTLVELYSALNDQMTAAGILPDLQLKASRPASRERPVAPAVTSRPDAEAPVELGELRELLGQVRTNVQAVPADALPVTQGDLTRLLSILQRQPAAASGAGLRQQLDALLARASANSPRPRVIGRLDEEMITLVSMLFEQVLGDAALPEPMRGPIGELQVPLLKAALIDQNVFAEQSHPARQLLNEVTLAARDSEELADMQRDRLRGKIDQVSKRLREEFTDDPSVFDRLLEDFGRFTASERKRAARLEQRLLEAEEARALRETVRQQVDRLLSERLQALTLPAAIVQGLERGWGALLQLILLREGEGGEEWVQAVATLDELLARLQPLRNREDARLLVGPRRSELLDALKRGLEQVTCDAFEQRRFFEALAQWQRKLLADFREGVSGPAMTLPLSEVSDAHDAVQAEEQVVLESAGESPEAAGAAVAESEIPLLEFGEVPAVAAVPSPGIDGQGDVWGAGASEVSRDEQMVQANDAAEARPPLVSPAGVQVGEAPTVVETLSVTGEATVSQASPEEEVIAVEASHWALVDGLGAGSWVEFCVGDGSRQRCKMAAFIRVSGQFIFVNRAGAKVATYDRDGLAHAFASGAAHLMDNSQPFDQALRAIISNLREMRAA